MGISISSQEKNFLIDGIQAEIRNDGRGFVEIQNAENEIPSLIVSQIIVPST